MTDERINDYLKALENEERATATIEKYRRALLNFAVFLSGAAVTQEMIRLWKDDLRARNYVPSTINTYTEAWTVDGEDETGSDDGVVLYAALCALLRAFRADLPVHDVAGGQRQQAAECRCGRPREDRRESCHKGRQLCRQV